MTDAALDWILLAVDKDNDAFILDADLGFWENELLTEHWAADNGVTLPNDISIGLWRMTDITPTMNSCGDCDFTGTWEKLA